VNNPREFSAGQQVLLTIAALCAILLAIGGLFFFGLRAIDRRSQTQQFQALNKLAVIDDTAQDVGETQAEILRQILVSDPKEIARLDRAIRGIGQTNAAELTSYKELTDTDEERQLYEKLMQARKAYWEQTDALLALSVANRDLEAEQLAISKQVPLYDEYLHSIDKLIKYVESGVRETTKVTAKLIERIRVIGNILVGAVIVIVIGSGFTVVKFARRLKEDNKLLQSEVAERKKAEQQLNIEYAVSRILAESTTFQESVQKKFGVIGAAFNHEVGALWMLDHRAGVLKCTETWKAEAASADALIAGNRGYSFAKGIGLPGRVWATGEAAWIADISQDTNFPRRDMAERAGMRRALLGFNEVVS
jgi:hypothetical protein